VDDKNHVVGSFLTAAKEIVKREMRCDDIGDLIIHDQQ
jgi:hypothetical protein